MTQLTRFILVPAVLGALLGLAIIVFTDDDDKPGYAQAVASAAPAVVNIYTSSFTSTSLLCRIPAYRDLCQAFGSGSQVQNALGSGVIMRADGYVLTNNHVVAGADEILVMFANNQTISATVIGTDPHTDLAVIKVPAEGLPVIPQLENEQPEVGDVALAIGNPFGLGHSVSQGIISGFSRTTITISPYDDFIQTDAAISPGNSGGALIDYRGRLLGINTMIYSQSGGSEGIGFAIPADIAIDIMNKIVEHGRVIRGWLGIRLAPHPTSYSGTGLAVAAVTHQGPAFRAGIRPGDVIHSVNGTPAVNAYSITRVIAATRPGSPLAIEVARQEQRFQTTATAGELPSS